MYEFFIEFNQQNARCRYTIISIYSYVWLKMDQHEYHPVVLYLKHLFISCALSINAENNIEFGTQ